jgi:hypothetical protein
MDTHTYIHYIYLRVAGARTLARTLGLSSNNDGTLNVCVCVCVCDLGNVNKHGLEASITNQFLDLVVRTSLISSR